MRVAYRIPPVLRAERSGCRQAETARVGFAAAVTRHVEGSVVSLAVDNLGSPGVHPLLGEHRVAHNSAASGQAEP